MSRRLAHNQRESKMKKTSSKKQPNAKPAARAYALLVKADSAGKIFEAARTQWRLLKSEHKQARKAFKQAKKAFKLARREAKAAAKDLKRKGIKFTKTLKPAMVTRHPAVRLQKSSSGKRHSGQGRNGHRPTVAQIPANAVGQPVAVQLQA